jgi:hypothetical protein
MHTMGSLRGGTIRRNLEVSLLFRKINGMMGYRGVEGGGGDAFRASARFRRLQKDTGRAKFVFDRVIGAAAGKWVGIRLNFFLIIFRGRPPCRNGWSDFRHRLVKQRVHSKANAFWESEFYQVIFLGVRVKFIRKSPAIIWRATSACGLCDSSSCWLS